MEVLEHYYHLIENVIKRLGVDPGLCKGDKPGQYDLKKGSANIWIDIWKVEGESYGYIQIMAPIYSVPAKDKEALYKELLEINHKLFAAALTLHNGRVYAKSIRELDGLNEDEAFAMFNRVGNYADDYDDYLTAKYGK
jgi:hypothetical protein